MLDFYLINDDVPSPEDPDAGSLEYAGCIDISDFKLLKSLNIIEGQFNYSQDFRWTAQQVGASSEALSKVSHISSTYVSGMLDILFKAKKTQMGLIAYCD